MLELLKQPWPWYISGPIIGISIPLLLIFGNKILGISSSFRHTCAAVAPFNIQFLKYNWKSEIWNMFFVLSRYAGGCTSGHAIMGISNLQWPSLIAVIFFFIGGLLMTHFIAPFIYQL